MPDRITFWLRDHLIRSKRLNATRIVAGSFAVIILVGTLLLLLPIASRDGRSAGLFTALFTALPGRRTPLHCSLPGALLASLGWLIFSGLYSIYVENFSAYANLYGSVYAVALSMLWLYFCLSIVFYGAALNSYLLKNMEKT